MNSLLKLPNGQLVNNSICRVLLLFVLSKENWLLQMSDAELNLLLTPDLICKKEHKFPCLERYYLHLK
jgi:hypothetical protein